MKTILSLLLLAAVAFIQTGCTTDASVSHDGHRHGVGASVGAGTGGNRGSAATAGARAY